MNFHESLKDLPILENFESIYLLLYILDLSTIHIFNLNLSFNLNIFSKTIKFVSSNNWGVKFNLPFILVLRGLLIRLKPFQERIADNLDRGPFLVKNLIDPLFSRLMNLRHFFRIMDLRNMSYFLMVKQLLSLHKLRRVLDHFPLFIIVLFQKEGWLLLYNIELLDLQTIRLVLCQGGFVQVFY